MQREYAVSSPETAKRTLRYLCALADADGLVTIGLRQLGDELGIGRNTAHTALRRLTAEGHITEVRHGTGNLYPTTWKVAG